MKAPFSFVISLLVSTTIVAQVYTSTKGEVSFYSKAPLEDIEAHTTGTNSILHIGKKEIAFIIPIRGFKFEKALMQEHFNEKYMESDLYPNATYSGKINEDVDLSRDGKYEVTSTGKLKIHGVEKIVTLAGTISVKGEEIVLQCDFKVAIKDYNITVPKLLFQNIADIVDVRLNVTYSPFRKK